MRRTLILAAAVLAAAIALCAVGGGFVGDTLARAEALLAEAVRVERLGNVDRAEQLTRELSRLWAGRERLLGMLAAHDALFDVQSAVDDALICLENGDRQEFLRAMSAAACALRRIRTAEAVSWANLC